MGASWKSTMRKTRRLKLKKRLLFSAITVCVSLVICEALLRARAWLRFGTPDNGRIESFLTYKESLQLWVPKPGYVLRGKRNNISINSLGFRGAEFPFEKPQDEIRIVCLGGSTTFCADTSSDENAWPALLESRLRSQYNSAQVRVINAGVPRYTTDDSLSNLKQRVRQLAPDVIIVYHGNNDLAFDTRVVAKAAGIATDRQESIAWKIGRYSLLVDLINKNRVIWQQGDTDKIADLPDTLTRRFENNLGELNSLAKEMNAELILSTFIVKYRQTQTDDEKEANADIAFYQMPWMTVDLLLAGIDRYNLAVRRFGRQHNVLVVDDNVTIPGDSKHFVDCMHLSDKGCDVMAQRFANSLIRSKVVERVLQHRGLETGKSLRPK